MNNIVLYLDNTIRKGIVDNNPANIAPAPTATNKDGNAQQIKVPKLVNKLKECKELIKLFENKTRESKNVRNIAKNKIKVLSEQIKELEDLKKSLQWLVLKCPGDEKPDCPIINELAKK
jgi:hypothetical protein